METTLIIAIISASASILAGSFTFYLTKSFQEKSNWKKEKLNHYKSLLNALSEMSAYGENIDDAHKEYSKQSNTICLVASQDVVDKLMKLNNSFKKEHREDEKFLINQLMLSIRKDIGLSNRDIPEKFDFDFTNMRRRNNEQ